MLELYTSRENKGTRCARAHLQNRNSRAQPLSVLNSCTSVVSASDSKSSKLQITADWDRVFARHHYCLSRSNTFLMDPLLGEYFTGPMQSVPVTRNSSDWISVTFTVHVKSFAASTHQDCQHHFRLEQQGFKLNLVTQSFSFSGAWYWLPGKLLGRKEGLCLPFSLGLYLC